MKKLLNLLVFITSSMCLYAQTENSKIEALVRSLDERERIAMLNHDTTALHKLWDRNFTVNAPFNRVTLTSRALMDMVNDGSIRFTSFSRHIEQVTTKENIVQIMGSEEVVFTGDVAKAGQTIKRRFTNIWMKQNGSWRLAARHANDICQE
jgi:hypothetical protein